MGAIIYTERQREDFRRLWRAGASSEEIERATGIPAGKAHSRMMSRLGLARRAPNHGHGTERFAAREKMA